MRERGQKSISLPYALQPKVDLVAEAFRDAPGRPNYSAFVEWATDAVGSWLIENPSHFDRIAVREMLLRQHEERDEVQIAAIQERQKMRDLERMRLEEERDRQHKELIQRRGEFQSPEDVARIYWTKSDADLRKLAAKYAHDEDLVLKAAERQREIVATETKKNRKVWTFEELVDFGAAAYRVPGRSGQEVERTLRGYAQQHGFDEARYIEACRAHAQGRPQTTLRATEASR